MRLIPSAEDERQESQHNCQEYAEQNAGCYREVERESIGAVTDVAREMSDPAQIFSPDPDDPAGERDESADADQNLSECFRHSQFSFADS